FEPSTAAGDLRLAVGGDASASRAAAAVTLGGPLVPPDPAPAALWDALFVAVAGVAEAQTTATWKLAVVVRNLYLRAPACEILRLEGDDGTPLTADGIADAVGREDEVALVSPAAGAAIAGAVDGEVTAVLVNAPSWRITDRAPGVDEFQVVAAVS